MADDDPWRLPSSVQELAAGVKEPPSRYLIREQDSLGGQLAGADMPEPIPTIDLRRLWSASDGAGDEAAKLRSALQSWGFFLVCNHGIEASLMDDVMAASREFFHLPLEEKKKYSNLIDENHSQVEGFGTDPVKSQDAMLDWSDRLHLRVEPEDERNLAYWPMLPKRFRDVLHEYTVKNRRIKDAILRAMARLLELDEGCLVNQFGSKASTYARLNYYPPCPRPDLVLGFRPHADTIALTVLLMDRDVDGLQVLRDRVWYNVPAMHDHSLLINVGVTAEIMSNGVFRAPVHRAVTNAEKERISLALFYSVEPDKVIEPIAVLLDEKRPARYKKIKAKDLRVAHFECMSRGERVADFLKIK